MSCVGRSLLLLLLMNYFCTSSASRNPDNETGKNPRNVLYITTKDNGIPSDKWKSGMERLPYPMDTTLIDVEEAERKYLKSFYNVRLVDSDSSSGFDLGFRLPIDPESDNIVECIANDSKDVMSRLLEYEGPKIDILFIHCEGGYSYLGTRDPSDYTTVKKFKEMLKESEIESIRRKFSEKASCLLDACKTLQDYETEDTIGEYLSETLGIPVTGSKTNSVDFISGIGWTTKDDQPESEKKILALNCFSKRQIVGDWTTVYPQK